MERMILEQHTLSCCAINIAEVYVGLRTPEADKAETLLRQLTYVPIRWGAKVAGNLKREWARKGHTLTLTDTALAAVRRSKVLPW